MTASAGIAMRDTAFGILMVSVPLAAWAVAFVIDKYESNKTGTIQKD